ncbi:MAG: hypothetical protein FI727_00095 [SAR202 cluster bacterium]|nr:hypothetical protein [SAR202 cluster bacterium]
MSYPSYQEEFRTFPSELVDSFNGSREFAQTNMNEQQFGEWVDTGLTIARRAGRSWEAARDYFKVSPSVLRILPQNYFLQWAQLGSEIAVESPIVASAYFKVAAQAVKSIRHWDVAEWAQIGKKLQDGDRRSTVLATRFFEVSGDLLSVLSFSEFRHLISLVDDLAQVSADQATAFLEQSRSVLPSLRDDTRACLSLISTLVKTDSSQVTESLEVVGYVLHRIARVERARFLALTGRIVEDGVHAPSFIGLGSYSMNQVDEYLHAQVITYAESLARIKPLATIDFLQGVPNVLRKVSIDQLEAWYNEGISIIEDNDGAGSAFFRGESAHSEQVLEKLSVGVELSRVKEVMRMYCRALTNINVEISQPPEGNRQAKGWVSLENDIAEDALVFLPMISDKFDDKDANFDWFKVVATHQVAHLEFRSFLFSLTAPSPLYVNQRADLISEYSDILNLDYSENEVSGDEESGDEVSESPIPDIQKFFALFEDVQLVRDIFTAAEDLRLDRRVVIEYQGIRNSYWNVQKQALSERPEIEEMPAKEAMVELLIRFSLQHGEELMVPEQYMEVASALWAIVRPLTSRKATVEDTAEATILAYKLISNVRNQDMESEEWQDWGLEHLDQQDGGYGEDDQGEEKQEDFQSMVEQVLQSMPDGDQMEGEERPYSSPAPVDYRSEFKPEMIQLLSLLRESKRQRGTAGGEQMSNEDMEQMLTNAENLSMSVAEGEVDRTGVFVTDAVEEIGGKGAPEGAVKPVSYPYDPVFDQEDQGGPLELKDPQSFLYDEWDYRMSDYRLRWCLLREKDMGEGDAGFYGITLENYSNLANQIRRQFELVAPQGFRKTRRQQDGDDLDFDAVIEAVIDRKSGLTPSDKLYNLRNKVQRDVAVAFLMDMSASTAEAIDETRRLADEWDAPDDPLEYMFWLRSRRGEGVRRSYKRIVDLEKESLVLLIHAIETIGDTYGIYGFSGYGRENVDFYVIKDLNEMLSDKVKRRLDKVAPLQATRMGPAIRHAIAKLERQEARTKFFFLISDGRPQDRGYSREGVEKEYAIHDTKVALTEARRKGITPFCLTVDKEGHDYLREMCQDMGYEVLNDIHSLPERLPQLYRNLTV